MLSSSDKERLGRVSELLRRYRERSGFSQAQLAGIAKASVRTISGIESQTINHKVGPKVLIKLALALGQDPNRFLDVLGYENVGTEKIKAAGKSLGLTLEGQSTTSEYFEALAARIRERHALLCVTFASQVGYANDRNVILRLRDLINDQSSDFWVACMARYNHELYHIARILGSPIGHVEPGQSSADW